MFHSYGHLHVRAVGHVSSVTPRPLVLEDKQYKHQWEFYSLCDVTWTTLVSENILTEYVDLHNLQECFSDGLPSTAALKRRVHFAVGDLHSDHESNALLTCMLMTIFVVARNE